MAYFPFFADIKNLHGLIIGGGKVAGRKIFKLLPYGPKLTVIAPYISENILAASSVKVKYKRFNETDLQGVDFVIAASDDREVNSLAAKLCKEKNIPINVADSKEESTFLFPSLIKRGALSIGISTEGISPTAAVYLKDKFSEMIPDNFDLILEYLSEQRCNIVSSISSENLRKSILKSLFFSCIELKRPLTTDETRNIIDKEILNEIK